MSATIIYDLVKALEFARDGVRIWRDNAVSSGHAILDVKLAEIDSVLARAKQLDLDRAEVRFFYESLRDLTRCKVLFGNDVEVICIPLRPTSGGADG